VFLGNPDEDFASDNCIRADDEMLISFDGEPKQ
jgi:hypothetical protein